ncbi:asparagine synthase (glutamine-hydrolyzing) [Antribacter sp. KLBMP9083]|uniref:asparagine synthase (glutamine-hydrolyzing) n=1 Tax=Antribacter soli TaxID=2910976 RepID=A0AA41U624_9MICO|nr:asparagine synthase (glutamine-hydrolyzing) [Antribacter soli]MCF4119986.1 asparagine synthase (glutamine-hydrolyzing) [Antribacter soli]
MCGIAGIRDLRGVPVPETSLKSMSGVLAHRGPDESSHWSEPGIGLAHTRLSIIDLAASHQPMHSADGDWVLVFNGEIFNYRALRATLDYPFRTDGDTEVLLAGLVRHGVGFVARLRGQFAFAAYHRPSGVLHLVRDRLGVLPLYYRADGDQLTFCSEVKGINAVADGAPAVDPLSLDAYLASRSVPAPHTLFDGVRKLPAGHRAEVLPDGTVTVRRYWSAPAVDPGARWTETEAVDAVDRAVRAAVEAALVADVPVGSYLSGGVDSSLIVAVMKQLRGDAPVDTFAAGFGDPRHDELGWARMVSDHVGTRHHEVHVRAADFEELWPRLTWHRDAPVSEPADMAVFRLAELARKHVTVVLSGEGGDELFGGYPKYRLAPWLDATRAVPAPVRGALARMTESRLPGRLARARVALRAVAAPTERDQLQSWFAPFTAGERQVLLGGAPAPDRVRDLPEGVDAVDRMLRYDLESWLPDNLLERGDRMSMASSLELRPPMLDHELVELAFGLPSAFKVRHGVTKWVLKEVARRYLPQAVVDRKKVGFRVPLDEWFRSGLRDSMWERLTDDASFVGSTLDRATVRGLLERHDSGRFNEESRLWTLLSLEVWHDVCIRDARVAGARGPGTRG